MGSEEVWHYCTTVYLLPITELCRQLCGFLWLGRRQLPPAVQRYLSLMA